jgi:hypothetical protein
LEVVVVVEEEDTPLVEEEPLAEDDDTEVVEPVLVVVPEAVVELVKRDVGKTEDVALVVPLVAKGAPTI